MTANAPTPAAEGVEALMALADKAIHAYAAWLAETIAGEIPSAHVERLNDDKDKARRELRTALESLSGGGKPVAWEGSLFERGEWSPWRRLSDDAVPYWQHLQAQTPQRAKLRPVSAGEAVAPVDVLLFCPKCKMQHVDTAEHWGGAVEDHRSHLCVPAAGGCGHIWRAADVPTNGVAAVKTKGKADSPLASGEAVAQPVGAGDCESCEGTGSGGNGIGCTDCLGTGRDPHRAPLPAAPQVQAAWASVTDIAKAMYEQHPTYRGTKPLSWYDAPKAVKREWLDKAKAAPHAPVGDNKE